MRLPAVRVRCGLHQEVDGFGQRLQPSEVPQSPAPIPGARAGGVQLRPPLLPVLRAFVRGAAEENHRPVVLLRGERERGGEGGEAQLPQPAELLLERRAVSVE